MEQLFMTSPPPHVERLSHPRAAQQGPDAVRLSSHEGGSLQRSLGMACPEDKSRLALDPAIPKACGLEVATRRRRVRRRTLEPLVRPQRRG
jgi:hypothetical protein